MAKNTMADLRDHLFETIEMLKERDNPMCVEVAKAICDTAQTIINSAKVEVDLVKAVGGSAPAGSAKFFGKIEESRELPKKLRIAQSHDNGTAWPGTLSGTK